MFNLEHNRIYELAIDHNDVCFDKINEHIRNVYVKCGEKI